MLTTPSPTVLAACMAAFLSACAGAAYQRIPGPPPDSAVAPDACRVYVARLDVTAGSLRNVRVFDGDMEVGVLGEEEYLCWDRPARRGTGFAVFEGMDYHTKEVENVFDLPRDGGTTTWLGVSVRRDDRKPQIERLSSEEGRALIAKRRPAGAR